MKKSFITFFIIFMSEVASANVVEIDGIYYDLDSNAKTAEVTNNPDGGNSLYVGDIQIPKEITHQGIEYTITSIGNSAFRYSNELLSVILPDCISSVGVETFAYCDKLTSVTFYSPSLISYGNNAFYNYNNYAMTIYVPKESVGTYKAGWHYFSNQICSIGDSSGSCGDDVIYSYDESTGLMIISGNGPMRDYYKIGHTPWGSYSRFIKKVIIEPGITAIGSNSFANCRSLSSITIPVSVESVSEGSLSSTPWYDNQPDGVVYAGKTVYKYKGNAPEGTNIEIKDGTLSITAYAFSGSKGIVSVSIPNSVKSIGIGAFAACEDLLSIKISDEVTDIKAFTFNRCVNLNSIKLPENLKIIDNYAFQGCSSLSSIIIPDGTESINQYAFLECTKLENVTLPNSLNKIGSSAFYGCSSLAAIEIPNGVSNIGEYAFCRMNDSLSISWFCLSISMLNSFVF